MVPLDPHLPRLSPALRRDPHYGPASLEQAVTANHEVPNAELNHERLRSTVVLGIFQGIRFHEDVKNTTQLEHGGGSFLLVSLVQIEDQRTRPGR